MWKVGIRIGAGLIERMNIKYKRNGPSEREEKDMTSNSFILRSDSDGDQAINPEAWN